MKQSSWLSVLLLVPALLLLTLSTTGCGKKEKKDDDGEDFIVGGKKNGGVKITRIALKAPLDGVIKGKVTFKGPLPKGTPPKDLFVHPDCKNVVAASKPKELVDQSWIVDENKGVENVVIYLEPVEPKKTYFDLQGAEKRTDTVILDQPHCAFLPHVQVIFPEYFDGKKYQVTGQKFLVTNNAPFGHNFSFKGDVNESGNLNIPSKTEKAVDFKYEKRGTPINVNCNIHSFMYARIFTFEHPFHARTNEDGTFEIKGVPTGMEVTVKAWHEVGTFADGYAEGKKRTFQKGDNTLNLDVMPK